MSLFKKQAPSGLQESLKTFPRRIRERPRRAATTAAGILAAATAGVVAARKIRGDGTGTVYHVRAANGAGWMLTRGSSNKPLDTFDQKRQAIEAGREVARRQGPSTLLIHRSNGKVARRHVYTA